MFTLLTCILVLFIFVVAYSNILMFILQITKKLKEKEIKRQEHIYEFILTEKHHCLTLRVMQKVRHTHNSWFAYVWMNLFIYSSYNVIWILECFIKLCQYLWGYSFLIRKGAVISYIRYNVYIWANYMHRNDPEVSSLNISVKNRITKFIIVAT